MQGDPYDSLNEEWATCLHPQPNPKDYLVVSNEFSRNVNAILCCPWNYYHYFLHEKTLLLRKKFWGPSFQDYRMYGLNIPRRLDTRRNMKQQKVITIQEIDICETT